MDTYTLLDTGASAFAFVDSQFIKRHQLPLTKLRHPRTLTVVDGRPIASGSITHCSTLALDINMHHEKALQDKPVIDPATVLLPDYHEYLDVFSKKAADTLPPHRSYNHTMPLEPGKVPPFGPLIGMSQDELKVLKKYLEEHLSKGFIRASSSPAAAPILFAKKPGGGL